MEYFIDSGYATMNKSGEELCGDRVQTADFAGTRTLVLADGMGSGVKANILSTMSAKILSTMVAEGADFRDCVRTIMETLPVCRERGLNYCTFTIIHLSRDGSGVVYEYDNPQVILVRGGVCGDLESEVISIADKTVYKSAFRLSDGDALVTMSDGAVFAGPEETLNYDWQRPQIMEYLDRMLRPDMSAAGISALLAGACMDLYCGRPGDDTTVAAMKLRAPYHVALMIGPPLDREREAEHVEHFLKTGDCHIVCGGSTSEIVGRFLGREVVVQPETGCGAVPPYSRLEGVELVTEGALTVMRVAELAERHLDPYALSGKKYLGDNAAEKIAQLLFERATEVTVFIGKTVNAAHAGTPADSAKKMKAVASLAGSLRRMGKTVTEIYH